MEGRSLLVTDVDNTVLGDDAATRDFAAWLEQNRDRVLLAYNSGRFPQSVWQSVEETDLPVPDAIIGGVGTQIYFPSSLSLLADWPHEEGWNADAIRAALSQYSNLELQPEHLQSAHKVSYFGYDLPDALLARLERQLTEHGLRVIVIYSSQRDLDVLPAGAGKGLATRRLAEHWSVPPDCVIVCGDSGNDRTMFEQGFRGVVVANAHHELKALSDDNVYHAEAEFAAGVLEGLRHWLGATKLSATNARWNPDPGADRGRL